MGIDLKVVQLLVSRMCHDLAGGVSAVNAGVELISEGGGRIDDEALALVDVSAKQTVRRLSFFRVAFGFGGGSDSAITLVELGDLARNYVDGSRVTLDWPLAWSGQEGSGHAEQRLSLNEGKVLLNLVLLATDALPRGGVVEVGISALEGAVGFAVSAKGTRAALGDEVVAALNLNAEVERLTARTVHAYYAIVLVDALKGELEHSFEGNDEVRLAAVLPIA